MKNLYIVLIVSVGLTLACGISAPLALLPTSTAAPAVITEIVTSTPTVTHYCFGIVQVDRLNLRSAPDYRSPADGAGLVQWQVVTLLDSIGDWYQVETSDGRRGYARAEYVKPCNKLTE